MGTGVHWIDGEGGGGNKSASLTHALISTTDRQNPPKTRFWTSGVSGVHLVSSEIMTSKCLLIILYLVAVAAAEKNHKVSL